MSHTNSNNPTVRVNRYDTGEVLDNGIDLPSIYRKYRDPGSYRKRRKCTLPTKYWDSMLQCVEFPDGVYINVFGNPEPDTELIYESGDDSSNTIRSNDDYRRAIFEEKENWDDLQAGKADIYTGDGVVEDTDIRRFTEDSEDYCPSESKSESESESEFGSESEYGSIYDSAGSDSGGGDGCGV